VDAAHEIRRPLGQVLVDQGLITAEQLEQALVVQGETDKQLGEVLVLLGFISPGVVANGLAEQHGGPLKTEYGISAGFGGERPEPPRPEPEPHSEAPDVLAPWRAAVEQRDAAIEQLRVALDERTAQVAALSEQLAESAQRLAGLEEQLAGRERLAEELRAALGEREEQLGAALARAEESAAAVRAGVAGTDELETRARELEARSRELEAERDGYAAAVEELRATAAAQAEDLAAREAEAGNLGDLEKLLEHVSGVLHSRIAELEAERGELERRLFEATAAPRPAPSPVAASRKYDRSSHLLWIPAPDGYRLLEREGRAPRPGESVEVDGVQRRLVVARLGPSPYGSSRIACAYLVDG
jgi:hypothetical protein